MNPELDTIIYHYGMPRRSGRYPYGSGEDPYQSGGDFLSSIEELKKQGFSDKEIAEQKKMTTTQLRVEKALAKNERRAIDVATAKALREKGYSLNKIAEKMGFKNDSSVRSLLNEGSINRMEQARATADFLKDQIDKKGMIDVGAGVERELNISREKLAQSLEIIQTEGYPVYGGRVPQATNPGKYTTIKVACPPGTQHKEIFNYENVHTINNYISHDYGDSFNTFIYPKSMDSKRLKIRYAEEGGLEKDGLVEIRRGVDDLNLGQSHYAQVRILVDNKKYIKGMAVYSDNLPPGVDVVFNTNKSKDVPKLKVLKDIKEDPDNPFGSLIKQGVNEPGENGGGQSFYYDKNGKKQLSLINKRAEEGDWDEWSHNLPSQFLSKQSQKLINKQLNLAAADKIAEYDSIMELNNPTVKRRLLQSFSDDCDAAAVHLKAAALPRQRYQVIIPVPELKDTEVYAPNYKSGEQVVLVRYPHGGVFEIPRLKVNNNQPDAVKVLGRANDAIGINAKVAAQLSGADFDGDTVMVIPVGKHTNIISKPPLSQLEGFDPKMDYGADKVKEDSNGVSHYYRGDREFKVMRNTQNEMGRISNLITDMTLKGAVPDELARAVKHSMVVIDAEKHKLDYKQSEIDNGIAGLKQKYQGYYDEQGKLHTAASTLISKASSKQTVLKRQGSPIINKETGELMWKEVHEEYIVRKPKKDADGKVMKDATGKPIYETVYNKDGTPKTKVRTQDSTKMAETKDAYTLSSGTDQENAYAAYANTMKSLGNQARKSMLEAGHLEYSPSARQVYAKEVESLDTKLGLAEKNAPRERQAQLIASAHVKAKLAEHPDMSKKDLKKEKQRSLVIARDMVGAKRTTVDITDREWEAIQAGAITDSKLAKILNHTNIDSIREKATPRLRSTPSPAKLNKINAMVKSGYTNSEIADAVNMSVTAVLKIVQGKQGKE